MKSSVHRRRICAGVLAMGSGIIALAGCRDVRPTAPDAHAARAARDAAPLHPPDSPDAVTLQLPAPDLYDGSATKSGDLAAFPHPTVVKAEVSGFVTYTPNFDNIGPPQGPFGPSGNVVLLWWDGNNVGRTDFVQGGYVEPLVTTYILFTGEGKVQTVARRALGTLQLDGFRPVIPGPFISCGRPYGVPCFSYGGNAGTVVLTRLQSDLTVTPELSVVNRNDTPYIDYRSSPMVVEEQQIPFVVDSSHWVPDPIDQGGDPTDVEVHAEGRGACQPEYDPACRRKMLGSGTFTLSAWVNGKLFSKSVHITVNPSDLSLVITKAAGPDLGGSFTTRVGERQISLEAVVSPASLGPAVTWTVVPSPTDGPHTLTNGVSSLGGLTPKFLTLKPQDLSRWTINPAHPGTPLKEKELAFDVTASVSDASGNHKEAGPKTVKQDEIDVMRQEYVDFVVPQGVPPRARFRAATGPMESRDYTQEVFYAPFDDMIAKLVASSPSALEVNSGYRNPVHNTFHVDAGKSSGTVTTSWHQYGCAVDYQVHPRTDEGSTKKQIAAATAYWEALHIAARKVGLDVEQLAKDPRQPLKPSSGLGHVHVEMPNHACVPE